MTDHEVQTAHKNCQEMVNALSLARNIAGGFLPTPEGTALTSAVCSALALAEQRLASVERRLEADKIGKRA
jgi:hypothetical protein